MKSLQNRVLKSVGTVRNYEQALTRAAEYAKSEKIEGGLRAMTKADAISYLEQRATVVGQKSLDMERQAIQKMMQHVTQKIGVNERLSVIKSSTPQALTPRAYTPQQVELVAGSQTPRNALATELAYAAGLRAHELLTLRPASERAADIRPALDSKFRDSGEKYTVEGKGGLIREVKIPTELALRLEATRLDTPIRVEDRGIFYTQHYDIAGGHAFSRSFSAASGRELGWSAGAHGLRHSYAQERMRELQQSGLERVGALETVSQELGHFRPEITETYLR